MKKGIAVLSFLALITAAVYFFSPDPVHAQMSPTYERGLTNFFTKLRQNNLESAVKGLWEDNEWIGSEKDDKDPRTADIKALKERYGEFLSQVKLGERVIGDRYVYLYYVAIYKDGPVGFTFEIYKPERKWLFLSFDIDEEIRDQIIETASDDFFENPGIE